MTKYVTSFAILAFSLANASFAHSAPRVLEFKASIDTENSSYVLLISKTIELPVSRLSIACVENCLNSSVYLEDSINTPIYVMQPKDGSDRVITLWTTGSSYRIVVYRVTPAWIKKIISIGSKQPPEISFDKSGNERIGVNVDGAVKSYTWSIDKYQLSN